jgi:EcsC protein family
VRPHDSSLSVALSKRGPQLSSALARRWRRGSGVVLTQKFAAQALPVAGALGGASVNYLFIEHFQETAQGHFTVRRLERAYGKDVVRAEYERLAQAH